MQAYEWEYCRRWWWWHRKVQCCAVLERLSNLGGFSSCTMTDEETRMRALAVPVADFDQVHIACYKYAKDEEGRCLQVVAVKRILHQILQIAGFAVMEKEGRVGAALK